jgi:hypothetical protein
MGSIQLPDDVLAFVEGRVKAGVAPTAQDYVLRLIRNAMREVEDARRIQAMLERPLTPEQVDCDHEWGENVAPIGESQCVHCQAWTDQVL